MTTDTTAAIDAYLRQHVDRYVEELKMLCAQPSVSATGQGVEACADLVVDLLQKRGLTTRKVPYRGHPFIIGRLDGASDRTLMFYNHYDVQPPEPFDLWTSPPFEPTVRDGALYARGAADDKGEIIARLMAIDAALAANDGRLPCNLIFFLEGEEEIGSPHVADFVLEHRADLRCDAAIWEVGSIDPSGRPVSTLGARGILGVEITVETLGRDAHSGMAHLLPSAAWRLVRLLNQLKDDQERILIPGFYDEALPVSARDLALLDDQPDHEAVMRETYGLSAFTGGRTYRDAARAIFQPTCNIQGITTGYQGGGMKTVIPARASVKIDFRLVPGQRPDDIFDKLRRWLDTTGYADAELTRYGSMLPYKVDPDDPFVQMAARAAEEVHGLPAMLTPTAGGSSPMYAVGGPFNAPIVFAGVSYWDNRGHAPDEHVRLADLLNGARHVARILDRFGRAGDG